VGVSRVVPLSVRCVTTCRDEQVTFDEIETSTRLRRPSLKSYEDSIFTLYTFFAAILTLRDAFREPTSLINAYFAAI
jgi:hypothetical protein